MALAVLLITVFLIMLRGKGFLGFLVSKFVGFKVSWFLVCWLLGFNVFLVSESQSFKDLPRTYQKNLHHLSAPIFSEVLIVLDSKHLAIDKHIMF